MFTTKIASNLSRKNYLLVLMRRYFWFNGEILPNKYFQHFDRTKTRHDRAKIGLAINTTGHHSKIILSPGRDGKQGEGGIKEWGTKDSGTGRWGNRGMRGCRDRGRKGVQGGLVEGVKKGDLYFIQLLDYNSKNPMKSHPISIH